MSSFSFAVPVFLAALGTVGAVQLRPSIGARPAPERESPEQVVGWVAGYARSATSTVLSMIGQAQDAPQASSSLGGVFELFEPCHDGDRLAPWLQAQGCSGLLHQLASCNFTGVEWLHGIGDKHTTLEASHYSPANASRQCAAAQFVAFKTVDQGHDLSEALPLLDSMPNLRILDVVRDPRGIWASWKSTWPLNGLLETKEFRHLMTDACETYAKNLNQYHPRVHRIVFEELMDNPRKVMQEAYEFLNISFGQKQLAWLNSTFDSKDCQADNDQYADCRSNHTVTVERWHTVLNETELATFKESPHCQEVAATYGYEL